MNLNQYLAKYPRDDVNTEKLKSYLGRLKDPEIVLDDNQDETPAKLVNLIENAGRSQSQNDQNPAPVPTVANKSTTPTQPKEKPITRAKNAISNFRQNKWVKRIAIGVGIIFAILMLVFMFWFRSSPESANPERIQSQQQPQLPTQQLPDQTNVPDTNSSPGITFQMPNIDGLFGSSVKMQLHNAPKTYKDILGNWIVWLVLVFLVRLYLTTFQSETNDRKEPKDYNATMKGLYYFLILFILAVGITPILVGACGFFEKNCSASNLPLIIRIAGAALFIGTAIGAATGGNWDASPIAFAFLISGLTFKLGSAQGSDAGSILIIVGVGVQIYEMLRHEKERYAAIFGTLLALVLALIVGGVTMIGINTLGIRYFPAIVPYQLVIGFVVATITALGSSGSLVEKQVQGILPVGMREEVRDPKDSVYLDIKLFVLMIAIAIIVF